MEYNPPLSPGEILIRLTEVAISNGNSDELRTYLDKMPLEQLSSEESSSLMIRFLSVAQEFNQPKLVGILLEAFEASYPQNNEKMDFFSTLFLNNQLPIGVLSFVASTRSDIGFADVIDELIEYDPGEDLISACSRVNTVYGPQDYKLYISLKEDAEARDNPIVYNFLNSLAIEQAPFAEIPPWVRNFLSDYDWIETHSLAKTVSPTQDVIVPTETLPTQISISVGTPVPPAQVPSTQVPIQEPIAVEGGYPTPSEILSTRYRLDQVSEVKPDEENLPNDEDLIPSVYVPPSVQLPSLDEMVVLLTEGLIGVGAEIEDIDETRRVLKARLNIAPISERLAIYRTVVELRGLEELQFNLELFRLYGPANPFYDSSSEDLDQGGPRMLTALNFDYDEEENEYIDWFEGYCLKCGRRIRRRWHAVRIPEVMGGWYGCYCSIQCIHDELTTEELTGPPNLAKRAMVDSVEEQLLIFGIQDRLS